MSNVIYCNFDATQIRHCTTQQLSFVVFLLKVITSVDARNLKLSAHDDRIYDEFRLAFPDLNIAHIVEDDLKSTEAKKVLTTFFKRLHCKGHSYLVGADCCADVFYGWPLTFSESLELTC